MANENTIQATGTFITRKGLNLITKLVAAKGTLSFSRAAVGTGKPPEGYSPDSMISLSSYKMDAEIADYGTQEDKAYVTMQVSSDQVEEGFLLTEVGLYATDPDQGEILYAYMDISTDPTYIYANGSANRTKYAEFTLYVLIGTVEKVTAAVTPGSIITKETFKASNLPVIDTYGIMGDSGSTVMSQELFDAVAEKIVNELVGNEKLNTVLTEKLADYIMKSKIVNHLLATDESTVLSGPMGKELKGLLDVLNTKLKSWDVNKYDSITDTKTGMTVVARRIRNIVLLHLSGYPSAETKADSDITVATLVTEFRPLYNLPWNTYNHQGLATATPILLRINATGEVIINFRTTPNTQQFINAVYVYPVW